MLKQHQRDCPTVLCLSGLDPTGGAGIAADISTIASLGGHALPVVTTLTVQDTLNVKQLVPVSAALIKQQIATIEADIGFDAIKIGMLADADTIKMLGEYLTALPNNIPVVVDPIIAAGGGFTILTDELLALYSECILPFATIVTPNLAEAKRLAPSAKNLQGYAETLLNMGSEAVLVTGIIDKGKQTLSNTLFTQDKKPIMHEWPLLDVESHGSGCTLASAIAGMLIFRKLEEAIQVAQHFAFHSVANSFAIGQGQLIPNRFFWAEDDDEGEPITAANDEE